MRVKYPRTLHHPSSPGVQSDDKIARDLAAFEGADVVVTEKMDGENVSLYADGWHARSLDTGYHPSRDWLSAFHARIGYRIAPGWRICGEYLYAQHSVAYAALRSYFLAFSIWDDQNTCRGWDETCERLADLDAEPVPVLYRGPYAPGLVEDIAAGLDLGQREGLVMRVARAFDFSAFQRSVVKWVRPGHVQSETHWRKATVVPNGLWEGGA